MRKILFLVLLVLVGILLFMAMVTEFPIQQVSIYTLKEIQDSSALLESKLNELSTLSGTTYPTKRDRNLKDAVRELELEKQSFEEKAQYSSEEDIAQANTQQRYAASFLWVRLGNYATKEGINANLAFTESSSGISGLYDIKLTLNGAYTSITEFIYSIETDQELNFRIQDFALVPGGAGVGTSETPVTNTEPTNVENQNISGQTGETATTTVPAKGTDTNILQATFTIKDLLIEF